MIQKKACGLIFAGVLLTLLVLLYWTWMFYMTQTATAENTYETHEAIIDVEVYYAAHRGNDKLYITSENNCYVLDTGWRNAGKTDDLAEYIRAGVQECRLTIWEHIPRSIFDMFANGFQASQLVDLRNDSEVYWDISIHNAYQKTERVVGIVAGIFLTSAVAGYLLLCFLTGNRIKRK